MNIFSTPDKSYAGQPQGTDSANNARVLNEAMVSCAFCCKDYPANLGQAFYDRASIIPYTVINIMRYLVAHTPWGDVWGYVMIFYKTRGVCTGNQIGCFGKSSSRPFR